MSGHSKWHNIQATKNKADAARGKIFTKIGREIAVAVKLGGADPNTNSKLYDVIQKAKQNNMPNDNINRSIKKAAGETDQTNYDSITYEGYGNNGVAFIVECLTDNKNRTAADVRHLFSKHGGSLGTTGSVMYNFNYKGVVVIPKKDGMEEDDIMMMALDAGADDVITEDDAFVIYTPADGIHSAVKAFEAQGIEIASSESEYIPINTVTLPTERMESIQKLYDALDDLDDVQNVYHNAEEQE
ncbi:MAG: YebC/PmpR family DNA-binding transcriptional regulator [Clostridia bacterium]|nr:YebC/PmpR family DNA-binding transcriptional regulator [Clostridia bacterium]